MAVVIRGVLVLASALALAACGDNTVNKDFEQQMKDRDAARAGDRYAQLENQMPQRQWYDPSKGVQYIEQVKGASGNYRANYDGLLGQLDTDKDIDRKSPLFLECRAAYTGASEYQSKSGDDAAAAAEAREKALAALKSCRTAAKKDAEKNAVLARFASTAIVMIGLKVVGQGDQERGLKIWAEGEKLVAEDRPGFEFGLKSFRGY